MRTAIVAIGYNRPLCIARLLKSVFSADYIGESVTLIVSIDKSANDEVERVARQFVWPFGEYRV